MPFLSDPAASFHWTSCPPRPLFWFGIRDSLLHLVDTPWLCLPLLAGLLWIGSVPLPITRYLRASLLAAAVVSVSVLYSPLGTSLLSSWLLHQLPPPTTKLSSVAVLVGRNVEITLSTTSLAARLERRGLIQSIYVSGDQRATAERLVALGVTPEQVAGDSCARTTWENATLTTAWLRQQNSGATLPAITLITDPWQLPRTALAFQRQGVSVRPLAAPIEHLSAREKNHLALRETAALILYRFQGRC